VHGSTTHGSSENCSSEHSSSEDSGEHSSGEHSSSDNSGGEDRSSEELEHNSEHSSELGSSEQKLPLKAAHSLHYSQSVYVGMLTRKAARESNPNMKPVCGAMHSFGSTRREPSQLAW
jgi:hypothetical protein